MLNKAAKISMILNLHIFVINRYLIWAFVLETSCFKYINSINKENNKNYWNQKSVQNRTLRWMRSNHSTKLLELVASHYLGVVLMKHNFSPMAEKKLAASGRLLLSDGPIVDSTVPNYKFDRREPVPSNLQQSISDSHAGSPRFYHDYLCLIRIITLIFIGFRFFCDTQMKIWLMRFLRHLLHTGKEEEKRKRILS